MAESGKSYASPLRLARDEVDVSGVRAHCREHHRSLTLPRKNTDVAAWHAGQHHRYHLSHVHEGPWVVITRPGNPHGTGQIARPMGWYTGQEMVSREDLKNRLAGK